ncbi:hypothetical protein ABZT07_20465 [Streptomyces sp. NPDC005317]|uniref:hypothetical protein n=1 Tax=Streptomyces sp. NPDC005317 TaxID=3156876 RepID=UPI0033A37110
MSESTLEAPAAPAEVPASEPPEAQPPATPEPAPQTPAAATPAAEPTAPATPAEPSATEPAPEADDDWSDPEKGREAKRKANQEAKKLRAEITALTKQLESRVDPTEAAASIELVRAESERTVARIKYGHQYGLPEAVSDRLQGETVEEIEADAKALAVHFGGNSGGLGRGGLDPTDAPTELNPQKLAEQIPRLH